MIHAHNKIAGVIKNLSNGDRLAEEFEEFSGELLLTTDSFALMPSFDICIKHIGVVILRAEMENLENSDDDDK